MRLFAGIELDDAARALCGDVQERLKRAAFDARYEPRENLHITLAFLGNIENERLSEIIRAVIESVRKRSRLVLRLDRITGVPKFQPSARYLRDAQQDGQFSMLAAAIRKTSCCAGRMRAFDVPQLCIRKGGSG